MRIPLITTFINSIRAVIVHQSLPAYHKLHFNTPRGGSKNSRCSLGMTLNWKKGRRNASVVRCFSREQLISRLNVFPFPPIIYILKRDERESGGPHPPPTPKKRLPEFGRARAPSRMRLGKKRCGPATAAARPPHQRIPADTEPSRTAYLFPTVAKRSALPISDE